MALKNSQYDTIMRQYSRMQLENRRKLDDEIMKKCPDIEIDVYKIKNNFFGDMITVSGLLTGRDIIEQLKGKDLGHESRYICLSSPVEHHIFYFRRSDLYIIVPYKPYATR